MSRTCQTCGYTEHYGAHSCAEELKKEINRLQEENERLLKQQPAAEYDGVEFSRYTLRWANGPVPVGTKLYAAPILDVQDEKNRHDAEELEALHMNLRDRGIPTHDENGEELSSWGRVLRLVDLQEKLTNSGGHGTTKPPQVHGEQCMKFEYLKVANSGDLQTAYCPLPLAVIPNHMGINLCSVERVEWESQDDGQLVSLTIRFTPAPEEVHKGRQTREKFAGTMSKRTPSSGGKTKAT